LARQNESLFILVLLFLLVVVVKLDLGQKCGTTRLYDGPEASDAIFSVS